VISEKMIAAVGLLTAAPPKVKEREERKATVMFPASPWFLNNSS